MSKVLLSCKKMYYTILVTNEENLCNTEGEKEGRRGRERGKGRKREKERERERERGRGG
jgi:hypothetical protein